MAVHCELARSSWLLCASLSPALSKGLGLGFRHTSAASPKNTLTVELGFRAAIDRSVGPPTFASDGPAPHEINPRCSSVPEELHLLPPPPPPGPLKGSSLSLSKGFNFYPPPPPPPRGLHLESFYRV